MWRDGEMMRAGVYGGTGNDAGRRLLRDEEMCGQALRRGRSVRGRGIDGHLCPQTVSQTEIPAPLDTGLGEAVKGAETWD